MEQRTATTQKPKPSLLSYRGFRDLWIGNLISQFGDVLYALVFLWMVLEVTRDKGAVGVVGACQALPAVLLSPYAGALADRRDRRMLMLLSDLASAGIVFGFLAVLLVNPKPALWLICTFAFALSGAALFAAPAKNAATPRLVPPERLKDANALNSATQHAMPLAGNAVAAAVLQAIFALSSSLAYVVTFTTNGLSFLLSAVFMLRLPKILPEREDAPKSALRDAWDGMRFVLHHKVLCPAILVNVALNFFIAPFMPAYVVLAQEKFKGTPALLAFLETGFFVGMLLGSLLTFRLNIRRVGLSFSFCLFLAAIAIVPMGRVNSLWLFWILNFLCGILIPPASIPLSTLIQLETPDGLRGRVNAAMAMLSGLVTPVGMAMSGFLMQSLGIEGTFVFMGVGLGVSPLLALFSPDYRKATLPPPVPAESEPNAEAL